MSDVEFWASTPAKIFALLEYHSKVENPDNFKKTAPTKEVPKMTLKDFQSWGGVIR